MMSGMETPAVRLRDMRPDEYDAYTAEREHDTAESLSFSMPYEAGLTEVRIGAGFEPASSPEWLEGGHAANTNEKSRARSFIVQPFTAPAVRPPTRYFCRAKKSAITGAEMRSAPAAKWPQSVLYSPT